ncbi:MAG TPA: PH domain-containing protein [Candidatus Borkfalkia excrementipullorum]|nr:PH domain-containing protein [Candidatus Borkfalkia excrementipullorum]
MKTYKFRFSKLVIILCCVALAAALAAIGYTIYRIYRYGFSSPLLVIQHVTILVVAVLAIVIFAALLIRSVYKITDKEIILWFGIIKQTFKIAEIESIHLFTKTNKLVIYFKDEKYTVIVVKPEWYNEFTKEILARNSKIRYDVSTTDGDEKD